MWRIVARTIYLNLECCSSLHRTTRGRQQRQAVAALEVQSLNDVAAVAETVAAAVSAGSLRLRSVISFRSGVWAQ